MRYADLLLQEDRRVDYPKSVPGIGLVNGKFVDENTASGTPGSLIPSTWGNSLTDELLNVIEAGGLEPSELERDQLLEAIRALIEKRVNDASALPIGSMVPFPKGVVPPGFLEADGSVRSTATYPDLAAYLGTTFNTGTEPAGHFRLPESRGEFLRGWDHGRGVDAGRSLGSFQLDALQGHKFRILTGDGDGYLHSPSGTGGAGPGTSFVISQGTSKEFLVGDPISDSLNGEPRVGKETRPRNLAVMWCIKAWSALVNQGYIDVASLATQVAGFAARATALEDRPRGIGDGQAWQNVTASRVSGTIYTNTTGRPIMVQLSFTTGGVYTVVDGVNLTVSAFHSAFIVPAGSTYKITYGSPSNLSWVELRI